MLKFLPLFLVAFIFMPILGHAGLYETIEAERIPTICADIYENVRFGDVDTKENKNVTKLQDFLFDLAYYSHSGIGEFGNATLIAVKYFQKNHFLPTTGFVGPLTRALIKDMSCSPQSLTIENQFESSISASESLSSTTTTLVASTTPNENQTSTSTTAEKIKENNKKTLPFNSTNDAGWDVVWGTGTTTPTGTLYLNANASTTGAEAILKSSEDWTDYKYTANVSVSNGSITLIGRYTDDKNFLTCSFDGKFVALGQTLNGKRTTLASVTVRDMAPQLSVVKNLSVSMKVSGNNIGCFALGNEPDVSYSVSSPVLLKGGIGIETWNAYPGIAKLELQSVDVR